MYFILMESVGLTFSFMQIAVASANKSGTLRFQELNQKKYRMPLIVSL